MLRGSFSITIKLLLFVLPLVCIPITIVGYLAYQASVESVTRLSREEQMLQARAAATEINSIFQSCCKDLESVAQFLIEDFRSPDAPPGEAKTERDSDKKLKLFQEFGSRSPYCLRIRFLDHLGHEIVSPDTEGESESLPRPLEGGDFKENNRLGEQACQVSRVVYSKQRPGYVVYFLKSFQYSQDGPSGELIIDLDFNKVIDLVNAIRIGKHGFAFLVDQSGRIIAHPLYRPYDYNLSKYDDPRLREFVVDMITGETGWRTYNHLGEKAAAFAPVPATGWSLAVSIPIEEFKREGKTVRARVLQLVIVILVLSGLGVTILSYQLLKPVRRLVIATEKTAHGDLWQEIPVKSRDELGTLTRSFNRMIRNLREIQAELIRSEKLISMGKLSAVVAHEVRNPLNAMKGAIVYLQKRKSDDPLIEEYTQLILEEINRLNEFVTEFLSFAKQSSPNLVLTDFNELLQNTLNLMDEEFNVKGIEVVTHLEPSLPLLMVDPHQMEQVFLNLLTNARQAMADEGTLIVSSALVRDDQGRGTEPRVVITIQDDGLGIPEEQLKNIFDPFFSTKQVGTGLGLPISLGIVESHGGKIMIVSQEGKGTTVVVELPIVSQ